jgi:serine/threonine protein kinase
VYKAICKRSREEVVLKAYELSAICDLYQHQIFREVGLHASLIHENVVQLYAAFHVSAGLVAEKFMAAWVG